MPVTNSPSTLRPQGNGETQTNSTLGQGNTQAPPDFSLPGYNSSASGDTSAQGTANSEPLAGQSYQGAGGADDENNSAGANANLASESLYTSNYQPPAGSGLGATTGSGTSTGGSTTSGASGSTESSGAQGADAIANNTAGSGTSGVSGPSSTTLVAGDSFQGLSIQAIVLKVLLEAYDGVNQDAEAYAKKVQFYNNVKASLRNEQNRARTDLAGVAGSTTSDVPLNPPFSAAPPPVTLYTGSQDVKSRDSSQPFYADDNVDGTPVQSHASGLGSQGQISTKSGLAAYSDKIDNDLQTVGDDSSKAQTQLQAITSQQQQLLSAITQLIKTYNDTSLSIIRNI